MGRTPAERAAREQELAEAAWSTSWSAERAHEVAAWEHQRVVLANACAQARGAAGRMLRWSWERMGGALADDAGVPALSELSLRKATGGIVDLVYEMDDEAAWLFREQELYERRRDAQGEWQMWHNTSFDVHDARWAATCLRIQRGLLAVQFYVDVWRAACPGAPAGWALYDEWMAELGRLEFAGAAAEADAADEALAGLDLRDITQDCRMQTLLGALAGVAG